MQVTAQNHEVQVVGESLPGERRFHVSQVNLNDGSVEGLRHDELPIETSSTTPRARRARSTPSRCSTASSCGSPPARCAGLAGS